MSPLKAQAERLVLPPLQARAGAAHAGADRDRLGLDSIILAMSNPCPLTTLLTEPGEAATDEVLTAWVTPASLRTRGISHRALTLEAVVVDSLLRRGSSTDSGVATTELNQS